MMQTRRAAVATSFSRRSAPPRPLIRSSAGGWISSSAVHGQVDLRDVFEVRDRDALLAGELTDADRGGYGGDAQPVRHPLTEHCQKQLGGGAAAEPDHHPILDEASGFPGDRLFL